MVKCDCESKPKPRKKKTAAKPTRKVQATVSKTKTNSGNVVKNIIVINGCCQSSRTPSKTQTKRKVQPKNKVAPKPRVEPKIVERIEK